MSRYRQVRRTPARNLILGIQPQPWTRDGLCAHADDKDLWYRASTRAAKRICWACPVRSQCLAYALGRSERWGVYGGYTAAERRQLKRTGGAA